MCGIGLTLFSTTNYYNDNNLQLQDDIKCSSNWKDSILHDSLSSRGPDDQCSLRFHEERHCSSGQELGWDMSLYASVLHMRGKDLVRQPYKSYSYSRDQCYYLCWNGECYSHDAMYDQASFDMGRPSGKEDVSLDSCRILSDTVMVMNLLQQADAHADTTSIVGDEVCTRDNVCNHHRHHEMVASVLGGIYGEYSFILYCTSGSSHMSRNAVSDKNMTDTTNSSKRDDSTDTRKGGLIYFGRDPLGRRSLIMGRNKRNVDSTTIGDNQILDSLILSSVVPKMGVQQIHVEEVDNDNDDDGKPGNLDQDHFLSFDEIPAGRVYCLDLFTGHLTFIPIAPQQQVQLRVSQPIPYYYRPLMTWAKDEEEDIPQVLLQAAEGLYQHLNHAVRRRVISAPIVDTVDIAKNQSGCHHLENCTNQKQASVAVLFSGGVDSVVLAALCHEHVPLDQPIDLINVAFASSGCNENGDPFQLSPDRQAALLSFQEMKFQWPDRQWRFIAVNVDYEEVLQMEDTICNLIAPLTSTMDFNIGTALWFASRGLGEIVGCNDNDDDKTHGASTFRESKHLRFCDKGNNRSCSSPCMTLGCKRLADQGCTFSVCKVCCFSIVQKRINQYLGGRADLCKYHSEMALSQKAKTKNGSKLRDAKTTVKKSVTKSSMHHSSSEKQNKSLFQSHAKVVLVGIGADEQMAGYGRHRVIYNKGGYEALRQELAMEKSRLWTRNLGRDDRCISNHGKEARFPFLDDDVTAYLNSLDVTQIVDMEKPQGMGEKMILRLIAKRLGMTQCSGLVKRAIQFGSRIAKCSEVDRFGSSRHASGSSKHKRSNMNKR